MPLVMLKCRPSLYPTHQNSAHLVNHLRRDLPELLTRDGEKLLLDEGTPSEAVHVEVQKFGELSVNIPDIWLYIAFTEDLSGNLEGRLRASNEISRRVRNWLGDHNRGYPWPKVTIDIFWGPGHGFMLDEFGKVHLSW